MHLGFAVGDRTYEKSIADPELPDTSHITSKFLKIVSPFHCQENGIPSAAIRSPDHGAQGANE
jgi:hypothetical protein